MRKESCLTFASWVFEIFYPWRGSSENIFPWPDALDPKFPQKKEASLPSSGLPVNRSLPAVWKEERLFLVAITQRNLNFYSPPLSLPLIFFPTQAQAESVRAANDPGMLVRLKNQLANEGIFKWICSSIFFWAKPHLIQRNFDLFAK